MKSVIILKAIAAIATAFIATPYNVPFTTCTHLLSVLHLELLCYTVHFLSMELEGEE